MLLGRFGKCFKGHEEALGDHYDDYHECLETNN